MNVLDAPPGLYTALTTYLRRRKPDVVVVTGFKEQVYRSGYCETCADSDTYVIVWCVAGKGAPWRYNYCGDFHELVRELTDSPDQQTALMDGVHRYDWDDDDFEPPHVDDLPFDPWRSWHRGI